MRKLVLVVLVVALGCGKKQESGDNNAKPVDKAITCPPGQVTKDGACIAVITPEKVAAVDQLRTRLDDTAKLLDAADAVAAPIELLDGFRQLDAWKQVVAANPKLAIVDDTVATLKDGVTHLHALRAALVEAGQRLGNLRGELDKVLQQTGTAQSLADLQGKVKTEINGLLAPLEAQTTATIQKVIGPVNQQLNDTADLVIGACAMAKLSGGSDKMKDLCAQAKDAFAKATTFLASIKDKPALLFKDFTTTLELQLGVLVDTETKALIDTAQQKVDDALKLPQQGSGSGK